MSTNSATNRPAGEPPDQRGFPARRPVTLFLLLALGIGVPALLIPVSVGLPVEPFLLLLVFVALLGSALVVTRLADGAGAVRQLLSRVLIWRFSVGRWAVILFGMPVLTVAVAAASGTLSTPENGWVVEVGWYLFNTLIFGALILNLWEETAWAGFAQSRLMARHGLAVASLITAVFFAVIHVPLHFEGDPTRSEVGIGLAILFAMAPVYRYLIGMHLLDTGGSLLATGVQHASWNAVLQLDSVDGGKWEWQVPVAVVLLTVLVAVGRRLRPPSDRPMGREAEKTAAAEWIVAPPRQTD